MPENTAALSYGEAVGAALRRCLAELPNVIVYGEDVAKPGGVFGVTRRLHQEFGDRVFDTPISESAILGSAVGAAMMGYRPVVEIMWIDFTLVGIDQIINQAANVRYVSRGRLTAPLTIRTQQGAAPGSCAQHSQCLEALFTHIPGLRVCLPSTAQDAYDLLLAAVHCDDPVLVIENRTLYAGPKETVRVGRSVGPVGGSRLRRSGRDVTVVTWGEMTRRVLDGAAAAQQAGVSAEVLETPWLCPFDDAAVFSSVRRTRRLAVVHEANVTGGFGAEVVARVAAEGIPLDAPPLRIGLGGLRMPAAPVLARAVLPNGTTIARDLIALVTGQPRAPLGDYSTGLPQ